MYGGKMEVSMILQLRSLVLWGKVEENKRGMALINWAKACTPRDYGGLGLSNINLVNIALLLRWWWKLYQNSEGLWSDTVKMLKRKGNNIRGPNYWFLTGSFFWQMLHRLRGIFDWSTEWAIGDGSSISYWFDSWQGLPKAIAEPPGDMKYISLRDALLGTSQNAPLTQSSYQSVLNFGTDTICWKWENYGIYTSKSFYRLLATGGLIRWDFTYIWKIKVPPSVKVFAYLMLNQKILTRDNLRRRGLQCDLHCVLCGNCPVESILHLLFLCPAAVEVWYHVQSLLGYKLMVIGTSVQEIWNESCRKVRSDGMSRLEWSSRFICVVWHVWKARNTIIFRNERPGAKATAFRCIQEMKMWLNNC